MPIRYVKVADMSGPYKIRVYNNFNYMDEKESYLIGPFATAEQALRKAEEIVHQCLEDAVQGHSTVEEILRHYRIFGEDPTVLGNPTVEFSAWDYAESIAPQYGVSSTSTRAPGTSLSAIPDLDRGVPLRQLAEELASAGRTVHGIAGGLQFEDEAGYRTSITVDEPRTQDGFDYDVESVTRVITQAPPMVEQLLLDPVGVVVANQVTALGNLEVSGIATLKSRLSVYENEDLWNLYVPLLVQAALHGPATFAAFVNAAAGATPVRTGPSRWSRRDLEQVQQSLKGEYFCRLSDTCLTIVVPLPRASPSAHIHLRCDATHPTLGSGLRCVIEMPATIPAENLPDAISYANSSELRYEDRAPHFGAWCLSTKGNSMAYNQFLPDTLYDTPGIAAIITVWAIARAKLQGHFHGRRPAA